MNKKGKCIGVSVGPGDKRQITLEALETIKNADIVFLPTSPKEDCVAYKIIKEMMPEIDDKELLCETFTMSRDASLLKQRHQEIFEITREKLSDGKNVVFLALGEVALFSTYIYIHEMLIEAGFESTFISGISSVQAAAARLGLPLASGNENLHVFGEVESLSEKLSLPGTKVFMKNRKNLDAVIEEIKKYVGENPGTQACGVSNCGMDGEIVVSSADELDKLNGYFTVIFVRGTTDDRKEMIPKKDTVKYAVTDESSDKTEYDNSYSYFENRDCKYYPCHAADHLNCLFCYCPMYAFPKCPGNPSYIERDGRTIKNCKDCTFPHEKDNFDKVMGVLKANNA